jgi:hypothetical protein
MSSSQLLHAVFTASAAGLHGTGLGWMLVVVSAMRLWRHRGLTGGLDDVGDIQADPGWRRHTEGHGYGLVVFASVLWVMAGCFNMIYGIAAKRVAEGCVNALAKVARTPWRDHADRKGLVHVTEQLQCRFTA